jgi:hypothetical protein
MMACLRVRCGSSVYVQKKSFSLISRGGAVSFVGGGDVLKRVDAPLSLSGRDVVSVEVEAGILKE